MQAMSHVHYVAGHAGTIAGTDGVQGCVRRLIS